MPMTPAQESQVDPTDTESPRPAESGGAEELRASEGPRTYAGQMLGRTARVARLAIIGGGVATEIHRLSATLAAIYPRPDLTIVAMVGAITNIVTYVLIAWVACWLTMSIAALVDGAVHRAEASASLQARIASALERAVEVLDRPEARTMSMVAPPLPGPPDSASAPAPAPVVVKTDHAEAMRRAIREGRWEDADLAVRAFLDENPDDPEAARLADELDAAKAKGAEGYRARIEAAREANDPDRVLDLRDEVAPLLDFDARRALDQDLARWCMGLIQKRLRSGTIRPEVVSLAGKVAERLDTTTEGASLRAALPTLRRSVGLCARCGQPYTGVADACNACLGIGNAPASAPDSTSTAPDEGVEDNFE